MSCYVILFFSSRRLQTRCLSDWRSDVCSSDLGVAGRRRGGRGSLGGRTRPGRAGRLGVRSAHGSTTAPARTSRYRLTPHFVRSEERRVGKEGRSRGAPYHLKKKRKIVDKKRRT